MKYSKFSMLFCYIIISLASFSLSSSAHKHDLFECFSNHFGNSSSEIIYTPDEPSYLTVFNASIQNHRFASPSITKPLAIITPLEFSHVQATVFCSRKYGVHIRTRSGGHDFEGLSYVSNNVPFVMIDLFKLRSISIDVDKKTAWVQAGATLGELYYRIAETSGTLAFPGGTCPTVGVGGHISGGGYGSLMRKYGLAADHVVDAYIVNANGELLDRASMGEDLFWAIRGGGAGSFGVVVAWKLKLVDVPPKLTVFNVLKDLEVDESKKLVHRWQFVAEKLPEDLLIYIRLRTTNSSSDSKVKVQALFGSLYVGGVDSLIPLMEERFPELGLTRDDCVELSWIDTVLSIAGYPRSVPREILLERIPDRRVTVPFKGKLDYVKKPIPQNVLETMWERLSEEDPSMSLIQLFPYGGRMSQISSSEIPFAHRDGFLYKILYYSTWEDERNSSVTQKHLDWIRSVYDYMTPYVVSNPRSGYVNYRDLDYGTNNPKGTTTFEQASAWGFKYFDKNFYRLARVKTMADPTNYFRHQQSIPVLFNRKHL